MKNYGQYQINMYDSLQKPIVESDKIIINVSFIRNSTNKGFKRR